LIDRLLFNVQRAVFQLYSDGEQAQQNIKPYRNETGMSQTGNGF